MPNNPDQGDPGRAIREEKGHAGDAGSEPPYPRNLTLGILVGSLMLVFAMTILTGIQGSGFHLDPIVLAAMFVAIFGATATYGNFKKILTGAEY
ncbi:MAG: hypothetical protein MPL62_17025 [Alphaproteobacteria bacterium]|nr:hypothetical protein [Alphaproteobacteria bacterium]